MQNVRGNTRSLICMCAPGKYRGTNKGSAIDKPRGEEGQDKHLSHPYTYERTTRMDASSSSSTNISENTFSSKPCLGGVRWATHALGWNHEMRGCVSKKWSEAQLLHTQMRRLKHSSQGNIWIQIIWMAMENLWLERNRMEPCTTEEERSLQKIARMNDRLKRAHSKNTQSVRSG